LDGKEAIIQYKNWYMEHYGVKPSEKLIETFCKLKGIDIEKVREREEVAKVEKEDEVIMKHSELPWKFNGNEIVSIKDEKCGIAGATNIEDMEFIVEACNNYEALNTNYHNLLAEFQEVSAIAQEQGNEIEKSTALVVKLSTNTGKLLNIIDYYNDLFSPLDIGKLEEIKKEVG
jgi:hypothetical protein